MRALLVFVLGFVICLLAIKYLGELFSEFAPEEYEAALIGYTN